MTAEGAGSAPRPFRVQGDVALRGDYEACGADFATEQAYERYTPEDQKQWRRLYGRQFYLIENYAAPEFVAGVARLAMAEQIPVLSHVSRTLEAATGWQLVAVPGLIPDEAFFKHLASRRFPVTVWLRKPEEADYLVEPDLFHDFFGHVPLLLNPVFADYLRLCGEHGRLAVQNQAGHVVARLYWYMVEFGLIRRNGQLRAFGSGILSSPAETIHAVESLDPHRLSFDLRRVLRTDYRIDSFQQTYFVIQSFEELFDALRHDLRKLVIEARDAPSIAPTDLLATDHVIHCGAFA